MARFAQIDDENIVIQVVVLDDKDTQDSEGNEVESIGIKYLTDGFGGTWKQTSYNTKEGKHLNGKVPLRKNYASVGFTYDETRDAFIPPKPFNSWTLNEEICDWEPPTPRPEENTPIHDWVWNEDTKEWDSYSSPIGDHSWTKN